VPPPCASRAALTLSFLLRLRQCNRSDAAGLSVLFLELAAASPDFTACPSCRWLEKLHGTAGGMLLLHNLSGTVGSCAKVFPLNLTPDPQSYHSMAAGHC
jgi:hypothetical protein